MSKDNNFNPIVSLNYALINNYGVNPFKDEILNFKCETFQVKNEDSTIFYFTKKLKS